MRIDWEKVQYDLQYIILNCIANKIPSWTIRRAIYVRSGMQLGKGSRIGINTVVVCPQNIKISSGTIVNENCVLDGRGRLTIGRDTSISMYSKILSASHKLDSPVFEYCVKKTTIGNNVWTGTSAVILDGSKIGDFAVVGANSVVKGAVAEKSVMIGNTAREIKKRSVENRYCLNFKAYFR